jgi:hypothetical protein
MNSRTFSSSFRSTGLRAQLSPISRRVTLDAFNRRNLATFSASRGDAEVQLVGETTNEPTRTTSDRWWDPHLVDRLRSPLTRFHD